MGSFAERANNSHEMSLDVNISPQKIDWHQYSKCNTADKVGYRLSSGPGWTQWLGAENVLILYLYIFYTVFTFYMFNLNLSAGAALWVKVPYQTCECTSVNVPWPSSL